MNITQHAKQRYAERIMDRNDKTDVAVFIAAHEAKITEDINKMIEFGTKIYSGKDLTDKTQEIHDYYLNGTWVVIVNPKKEAVITLYSVDLGVGKDFNETYINLLIQKLHSANEELDAKTVELKNQADEYNQIIENNNGTIQEYRRIIKSLEEQNEGYKTMVNSLHVNFEVAEQEVRNIVKTMINRR